MIVVGCVSASHAAKITQAQDGFFDDPATWGGILPGSADNVLNPGWNLAITNSYTTTGSFQTYGGDTEITASGSVTAYLQHLNGTLRLTGGSLHNTAGDSVMGQVTATVTDLDNGSTALWDGWLLLHDNTSTININAGSTLTTVAQLALQGNAAANVFVNSNATLTVDWVHFQAGGPSVEKITVDGGVFNVMTPNAVGSFAFEGANASVWLENAGMIVWQGITNEAQFISFSTNFDGWVDSGRVDSASWTGAELKEGLRYFNGNAVANPSFDAYQAWAIGYGLTNSPDADPSFDYDMDGWANLYEYGLGGNPTNGFIDGEIPTFEKVGGAFEYTYARRTDDSKLDYYLELIDDLVTGSWTNDGYSVVATNVTGGIFDYVTNQIPAIDSQGFIRLTIERP